MNTTTAPDDSQQRALQRHLEDRERLLFTSRNVSVGEMASTLAHEINQPVGTIANILRGAMARLSQWAEGDPPDRDEQQRRVEHLQQGLQLALDQALFAARIMGRIRDYTHSRQPRREPVNLPELLRDSLTLLDWEFQRDGVHTRFDAPAATDGLWVQGDAVMLQQVVVNLLRNALDALRSRDSDAPSPCIAVKLLCRELGRHRELEVQIRDNGIGLSAQAESTLFVPFQSTKPTGMGIGLNICRSFVELHQGRLWFSRNAADDGTSTGRGCTFHVALPWADAANAQAQN
jgi:two-component system, LuxR family, sensor kinase FixL